MSNGYSSAMSLVPRILAILVILSSTGISLSLPHLTGDADSFCKNEGAVERFRKESPRIFNVLELLLSGVYAHNEPREYLAGFGKGKYTIADSKPWPWVKAWENSGFTKENMNKFPHLLKWVDRITRKLAMRKGIKTDYAINSSYTLK